MILIVTIAVVILLLFVLSNKLIVMDRGVDKKVDKKETCPVYPYVPPEVDKQIDEQIKTLQQILIPVQYVDNGLMPKIENATPKIEKALKPKKYEGPSPFSSNRFFEKNFKEANFKNELNSLQPDLLPKPSADDTVEPFNSFLGMVVSEGQTIGSFDPKD